MYAVSKISIQFWCQLSSLQWRKNVYYRHKPNHIWVSV